MNIADHFHELIPKEGSVIGLITAQNGICTSIKDLTRNVQSISNMITEGTLIIGMHNPDKGLIRDCKRTFKERNGKDTPIVVRTRQFLVAISESIYKINPDLLSLHLPHSEAGVIGNNAIAGMTKEKSSPQETALHPQRRSRHADPPRIRPRCHQFYSRQDFVTGGFALKYRNNPEYDVKFVKCRSSFAQRTAFIADHAYLGRTYQREQSKYIADLRRIEGFYDGKTR